MRRFTVFSILMTGVLVINVGCQTGPKKVPREPYTVENNPTVLSGRGEPSLDDEKRLAAWVLVDGYEGRYIEVDGRSHVEWVIDEPVSATPTFRVEAYELLLGTPRDFKCILKSRDESEESPKVYLGIAANDATFEVGKEYSLLSPGEDFVIRDVMAGSVMEDVGSLAPGEYLIAAGVKNAESEQEALAITYFTVQ